MVIALAAVALAAIVFAYLLHHSHQQAEERWEKERSQLLTRIQHPQAVIVQDQAQEFTVPEIETDPWANRVGEVEISNDWLNATDG